jgi:hypothetical protein
MLSSEPGPGFSDHAGLDDRLPTSFQKQSKIALSSFRRGERTAESYPWDWTDHALGTIAFYVHWARAAGASLSTLRVHQADFSAVRSLPHTVRRYPANQPIVRDGDKPSECCLIMEGLLSSVQDNVAWPYANTFVPDSRRYP